MSAPLPRLVGVLAGLLLAGAAPPAVAARPLALWAQGRVRPLAGFGAAPSAPFLAAKPAKTSPGSPAESAAKANAKAAVYGPCEGEIARAARRWNVPEPVLHAVGLTETGRGGALSPYALNIEGRAVFPASAQEALAQFAQARAGGARLIDLGCMQINHRWHAAAFASPAAMLDPALNVDYAARFLARLRAREGSWTMAVARYNAGPDNDPAQKRYVCAVIGQMARAGSGAWTDSARAFCSRPTAAREAKGAAKSAR